MKKHITHPMLKMFIALMIFSAMFAEAYSRNLPPALKKLSKLSVKKSSMDLQNLNATVYGKITDKETNEPIENAIVILFALNFEDFEDTLDIKDDEMHIEPYYSLTNNEGVYSIPVIEGEYFVYCEAYNYHPFYNINDKDDSGLVVSTSDNLEYNIQLEAINLPTSVTFSGKVTDQKTGEPIVNALVQFIPSELIDKGILEKEEDNLNEDWEYYYYNTYFTQTDEEGNYEIEVSDYFTYTALASQYETGYENEYYSETTNFYDAVVIDPTSNNFGPFDFTLTRYIDNFGVISGTVVDENDMLLTSTILAINIDNNRGGQSVFTTIAKDGEYSFDNLPYGQYILLSIPNTVSHIPGYYVDNNFASLNWDDATIIGVNEIQSTVLYTIQHQTLKSIDLDGFAEFEGRIGKKGSNIKIGDKTQKINALSGVTVYLMDKKGDILDYQITNSEGNFKFKNLPEGEFRIVSDKFGYYTANSDIIVDYKNGVKLSGTMEMEANLTLSVEDNSTITGAKISPMPVATSARVEFNSQNGKADIMIIDQTGKLISEFTTNTTEGLNELDFQTENMTNGTYFVIIRQNNANKSVKFILMK